MVAQASCDPVKQKELSYEGTKIICVIGFPFLHANITDLSFQAVEYGKKAMVADGTNAEAHKWFVSLMILYKTYFHKTQEVILNKAFIF